VGLLEARATYTVTGFDAGLNLTQPKGLSCAGGVYVYIGASSLSDLAMHCGAGGYALSGSLARLLKKSVLVAEYI
jgi:hypothetical protein